LGRYWNVVYSRATDRSCFSLPVAATAVALIGLAPSAALAQDLAVDNGNTQTITAPSGPYDNIFVGYNGTGTLNIDQVLVSGSSLYIAGLTPSTGSVTVYGAGGRLEISGSAFIGERGNGTLNITNGGVVTTHTGNIGMYLENGSPGTGTVIVDGSGSAFQNLADLYVGRRGTGTLVLSNGGIASAGNAVGTAHVGIDPDIGNHASDPRGTIVLGSLEGDAPVAAGRLDVSEVELGGNGKVLFNHFGSMNFHPRFAGFGQVDHLAGETRLLSNSGLFAGLTTVRGGRLVVGNELGGTIEVSGGVLAGTGSVGLLTVENGGTLAPGNSVGALSATSARFETGSVYEVEFDGTNADRLNVTNSATIEGGVVSVVPVAGAFGGVTTHVIVDANDLSGAFDGVVDDFAFITPTLRYDYVNDQVLLDIDATFSGAAQTPNQSAVAEVLDSLDTDAPYYDDLIMLGDDEGLDALDQLSGDGYASIAGILLGGTSHLRSAITDQGPEADRNFWASFYGSFGTFAGDGNAAEADSRTGGIVAGGDAAIGGGWHAGLLASAGTTSISARNVTADTTDLSIGAYARGAVGPVDVKLGASYTHHYIDAARTLAFTGVSDSFAAHYSAGTTQAFVELSHDIDLGGPVLTPFGSLAAISHSGNGTESGGDGALSFDASADAVIATIGLGISHSFDRDDGSTITLDARAGWQHAFADLPSSENAFEDGDSFTVTGAPIAEDALVLEAGMRLELTDGLTLAANYAGQIADGGATHAARFTLGGSF